MCRNISSGGRRCAAHHPVSRVATYAEARLDDTLGAVLEAFEAKAIELAIQAGPEPTEIQVEKALSLWMQAFKEMLAKVASATVKLEAKRAHAKAVRAERDAEHLAQIHDAHLREIAETAIAKHEAANVTLHAAQERARELEILRQIDVAAEAFGTRRELVQRALDEADGQLALAHAETERLRLSVTELDERPRKSGPLKGMPGATVRAFQEAQKQEAFYLALHKATVARLAQTPSKVATEKMLTLNAEQITAGKAYVTTTRKERDAALAARRRTKATEEPVALPAAA